jgi:hypothetical protein
MEIGDLNPITMGLQAGLNTRVNSLAAHYCDTQPPGLHISHDAWMITVKMESFSQ